MKKIVFALGIFLPLLMALNASADSVFNLDTGNSAISGYTGPYASVDVNLTSATMATITFTSLTNSGNIYLMGGGGSVGVNVNATVGPLVALQEVMPVLASRPALIVTAGQETKMVLGLSTKR